MRQSRLLLLLALLAGPVAAAGPADPLDLLREKLAEKLGATKAPDAKSPYVVQVSNAASGEFKVSANAARAPKPVSAARAPARPLPATTAPSLCDSGQRQSPIDIQGGIRVDLEPIQFDYGVFPFTVRDTGKTLVVESGGSQAIEVRGERYQLDRIEFRRPAEERIGGRGFPLGLHFVHRSESGRNAIVALLFEEGSAAQPQLQQVFSQIPLERGQAQAARQALDFSALLPADRRYFTYMGSMTAPPCDEGVLWLVLQQPQHASAAQIGIVSHLYPMNARALQAANGRLIMGSN
jgi:carbonic anhydrase